MTFRPDEFDGCRYLDALNVGSGVIGPYEVCEHTGLRTTADGTEVIEVRRPQTGSSGTTRATAINDYKPLLQNDYGRVTIDGPTWAAYDTNGGAPVHGDQLGVTNNSPLLVKGILDWTSFGSFGNLTLVEKTRRQAAGQFTVEVNYDTQANEFPTVGEWLPGRHFVGQNTAPAEYQIPIGPNTWGLVGQQRIYINMPGLWLVTMAGRLDPPLLFNPVDAIDEASLRNGMRARLRTLQYNSASGQWQTEWETAHHAQNREEPPPADIDEPLDLNTGLPLPSEFNHTGYFVEVRSPGAYVMLEIMIPSYDYDIDNWPDYTLGEDYEPTPRQSMRTYLNFTGWV